MVEKDQNVLVTQTVQKEKVKKETIEMQAKNSIKTLEEYCQSNSLPKPVFQKNKIKNWEVLAKVGSYEAKERGKLYTAERDAANNLLTKLKGLETKIQTEKIKKENIQIPANRSTNNLNSSRMKDQNVLDTPTFKAKKSKKEIQQKILQMQQQMQEQNSTESHPKAINNDPHSSTNNSTAQHYSNGTAKQNGQEELEKLELEGYALSSLLEMYPKINPGFLNSKFVEFDGNLEKVTDYIQLHDFSQVSNGQNVHKYEEFESALDSDLDPSIQQGLFSSFGENSTVKKSINAKGKWKKGQPKAADNDPQPSASNGTAPKNGQPNVQIPATKTTDNINSSLLKEGSWIWIEGLQGAKDLNGKLGQIVKFNKNKQRYEVFIPDSNGFNSRDFLPAKSFMDQIHSVSQIEFIRNIFRQEDESSLIGKKTFHISAFRIYLFIFFSKSENNFILNFRYETYQT